MSNIASVVPPPVCPFGSPPGDPPSQKKNVQWSSSNLKYPGARGRASHAGPLQSLPCASSVAPPRGARVVALRCLWANPLNLNRIIPA